MYRRSSRCRGSRRHIGIDRRMIAKDEESTKDDRDKKSENEGREDEERCVERRVMSEKDQEIRCEGSSSVQEIAGIRGCSTTH